MRKPEPPQPKTRDIVAEAVGMKRGTFDKAKIERAKSGDVVAKNALRAADSGQKYVEAARKPHEWPAWVTDPHTLECASYTARQVIGHYGFVEADLKDLTQELLLHLLRRCDLWDSSRASWRTFIVLLFKSKLRNIIESRRTQKRDWRRLVFVASYEPHHDT